MMGLDKVTSFAVSALVMGLFVPSDAISKTTLRGPKEEMSSRVSCPAASSIAPCTCAISGLDVTVDCSAAPSSEFLVTLFSQNLFPANKMKTFRMVGNSNVKTIPRGVFGKYMFQNVIITSNPSLTDVAPDAFMGSEAVLEHLDLSGNSLSYLYLLENLGGFGKLVYLSMANNKISGAIREFACPLVLQDLWLQGNQLQAIDAQAFGGTTGCPALVNLGVGGNAFTTLEKDAFAGLPLVEVISLNLCESLTEIKTGAFPLMTTSPNLKEVRLNGNKKLTVVEVGAIEVPCDAQIQMRNGGLANLEKAPFEPIVMNFTAATSASTGAPCTGFLDVTGSPIYCTCEMSWLLKESALKKHVKGQCFQDGIDFVNQPEVFWEEGCPDSDDSKSSY